MKEYLQSASDVLSALSSSADNGLSAGEAQKRLEANGKNKLVEGKKESLLHRFLKQLAEPMTIILIVAAAISGVLAFVESEFPSDVIIILAVVLINAVLGVLLLALLFLATQILGKNSLVMVVDRDGQSDLCLVLTDNVLVKSLLDLAGLGQAFEGKLLGGVISHPLLRFVDQLGAGFHAVVADIHARGGRDQKVDLIFISSAERAITKIAVLRISVI